MTRPRGFGWSVEAVTETEFKVTDVWTKTTVATVPTRREAWATVTALSKAASR